MIKKRLAVIVPGGFGTGKNNLGIPVLEQIVKMLTADFEITVFQLYEVNDNYAVADFKLLGFSSSNKVVQYLKLVVAFYRENRKKKFELVHGFWVWPCGVLAVAFGKNFRIKSVVSVLGGDGSSVAEINYGYLHRSIYRGMILWALHQADEAAALTKYLADNLKRFGLKRELKIIPWGVDPELFSFQQKKLGTAIQFLHIGNFHPVKDQNTLLKAFALILKTVECRLTIIGEGGEESIILKLIEDLGLSSRVTVLHHMPYSKLPEFYHGADILLHTSLSEGQSEVITEAMSCGLLVCGTRVGLIYDLPNSCISVDVKDFRSLADKIISMIRDPALIATMREQSKTWISNHDIYWTVEELRKLY